ncbi:MAG: hypothetical protein ACTSRJ_02165 [Candidatus Hodarchaeales archaeon]
MAIDILAEEQLKLELQRVLSKYFLRQLENLLRDKTGAFFPIDRLSNLELGKRLGKRKELQLMNVTVVDALQNKKFRVDLAFKFLTDANEAIKEANGAVWLEEMLKNNNRVKTARLLYFSKEYSLLIYEGLSQSTEFFTNELDLPQKFFLAGSALPYVHGLFRNKVSVDRYLHLITETLNGLNVTAEDRNELNSLFKPHLKRIGMSSAGAHSFGDFHPGNLMFGDSDRQLSNSGDLRIDKTIIYLIDAYNDYSLTQSFENTITEIQLFCKGYDYTSSSNGVKLSDYYSDGKTTIDFHIALGILIESLFKSRLAGHSSNSSVVLTSIEAAKHVLKKQPFEVYDN